MKLTLYMVASLLTFIFLAPFLVLAMDRWMCFVLGGMGCP